MDPCSNVDLNIADHQFYHVVKVLLQPQINRAVQIKVCALCKELMFAQIHDGFLHIV